METCVKCGHRWKMDEVIEPCPLCGSAGAFSPVAEYRGATIAERRGAKRAVWNGIEYHTDGFIWLPLELPEHEHTSFLRFQTEGEAKKVIDHIKDNADRDDQGMLVRFMGMAEFLEFLKAPSHLIEQARDFNWEWDEVRGVFVRNGFLLRSGQRRMRGFPFLPM